MLVQNPHWGSRPDEVDITKEQFASKLDDLVAARAQTETCRTLLTSKVNTTNARMDELNGLTDLTGRTRWSLVSKARKRVWKEVFGSSARRDGRFELLRLGRKE